MKYTMTAVIAVLFLAVTTGVISPDDRKGDKGMIEQQVMEFMKNLDTLDQRARMQLLSQVDAQRNELLGVLLKHLGTSQSPNVQAAAIYLIGRHRLCDGVDELVRRIGFRLGWEGKVRPEPLWEEYPAMEALITIGRPSVPPALRLLATDKDDLRRDLAVKVIRHVEDADIAKFLLQRAHAAETDPTRKANLHDALARLANLPR